MAARQIAGYAYWINALVTESGLPVRAELPTEKRRLFRVLARLLLDNGFDDIIQIEGVSCRGCVHVTYISYA